LLDVIAYIERQAFETMKVSSFAVTSIALLAANSEAFRPLQFSARQLSALKGQSKLHEFDYLLGEHTQTESQQQQVLSRRRIHLQDDRSTVLASTTFAAPGVEEDIFAEEGADPYADVGLEENPQMSKIEQQDQGVTAKFENTLKNMDLQDVVSTLIIPSIIAFAGLRWGYNKVAGRVSESKDSLLDKFASELMFYDGDFDEMKLCHADYGKKLMWLGPTKTQTMLKRYLALYAKKRTVSPQAIR
jgi:hypothetical protein